MACENCESLTASLKMRNDQVEQMILQIEGMKKGRDEDSNIIHRQDGEILELKERLRKMRCAFEVSSTDREKELDRLNGELLALLKKVDAVFQEPNIIDTGHGPILEIPYEVAAGVRGAMVNTSLKRNHEGGGK